MSKILVIEDDSATRLLLKRDLQLAGYEVEVSNNGEAGLQHALLTRPDLILCDWVMPLMDGVEVCRRVKAIPELANTFFILLTSRGAVSDRVEGLDAGADDFLSKPIELNELLARVRAGLRLYRYQQELSATNQQLNRTLQELQQTQAQLVQSEKMSSLGQMVAGIAHEINNPVNFISGNLIYTRQYLTDLLNLLSLYQKKYPSPYSEIEFAIQDIDFNFLRTDLPLILDSMEIGAARIRDIVLSLRKFSRLDQAEMKQVDIHEGIDDTLLIVQHRITTFDEFPGINIVKEYGSLPLIECYPGQLNQVFLNLINNAIDALIKNKYREEKEPSFTESNPENLPDLIRAAQFPIPTIIIRTEMGDENSVVIRISDNGVGMSESVRSRVFDPFFTTKAPGQGTGLGAAIGYQIVVGRHKGKLQYVSQLGVGTDVVIEIPIRQSRT